MKTVLFLIACTTSSGAIAEPEQITVTGKRLPMVSANPGPMIGDGPSGGGVNASGTSAGSGGGGVFNGPTNTQLLAQAAEILGETLTKLVDKEAWAELEIEITTPQNLKFRIVLKAGFGKTQIINKKKL